ncbi:hypothetical protein KC131_26275 [Pseudomonas sp. JQ170]|uniref:hypothetical protein n=1 Tax=unclassified Pseudomonas TaxID=196821 RepID=UPI00264C4EB5|nr:MULTISPECIES: hypothetical protein [unclassified Pseudomonas]MDN7144158.1 hypothetical protein [Pseudomonas sp. JQ170]WRO77756.1 hypothetical protein U9R80_08790 [Pseudomonas sp. 170C]
MREWIYAGALLMLSGCGGGDDSGKSATQPAAQKVGTIADWIMKDYPDNSIIIGSDKSDPTYGKFKDVISRVNQEKNDAAELVARKCQRVASVLFMRRESSLDNLRFMVDCESGERYEVTSSDISRGASVRPDSEKAIGRVDAIKKCKELVSDKYPDRSLLDFSEFSDSNYYKAQNGNVRLLLGFQETNAIGTKSNWRAACIFDTDWKGEVVITSN